MNNSDLGRVHAFLLRHRCVETKSDRRNISKEEKEIAGLLRAADPSMRRLLDEILDGQGLMLKSFDEFEAAGIPVGATVFVLARKPEATPPFFGTEHLITRMKLQKNDTDTDAKIWFTQLWFILLDLLYTRKNRSPNSLQEWVETAFDRNIFIDTVKSYLNDEVRKIDPNTLAVRTVYDALMTPKEGSVTRLCHAFLELMVDAGLLEKSGDDSYRQTLLFAFEMKLNYDRQLAPLWPSADAYDAASTLLIEDTEEETT